MPDVTHDSKQLKDRLEVLEEILELRESADKDKDVGLLYTGLSYAIILMKLVLGSGPSDKVLRYIAIIAHHFDLILDEMK